VKHKAEEEEDRAVGGRRTCRLIVPAVTVTYRPMEGGQNPLSTGPIWSRVEPVMPPNFVLLDVALPDVARLLIAMVQARDAVESRSWSHQQEPTTEEWWADVLADPRAQVRKRRVCDLPVRRRASSVVGTLRPSVLAVLRLIASRYFVSACTGTSAVRCLCSAASCHENNCPGPNWASPKSTCRDTLGCS
jgi:hypothetical protein